MKEEIFFACISILAVFEIGYYLMTPNSIWTISIGAITSIVIVGISIALFTSLNVMSSGESVFGARTATIASTLFCMLFQFNIPMQSETIGGNNISIISGVLSFINLSHVIHTPSIPVGIGLLYPNLTNVFLVDNMGILGMFGMIVVSIIMLMAIVSGIMIMAGD